jgi:alpha-galactosidase
VSQESLQSQQPYWGRKYACTKTSKRIGIFGALCALVLLQLYGSNAWAHAQSAGVAERPYLGWSSFSQQTVSSSFLTQAHIAAQSDFLVSSGLQSHGFNYVNIDAGWQGSFDSCGRPTSNPELFPDIASLISHIHQNGQKAGIYWTPGVPQEAVESNYQILDTAYHIKDILAVPYTSGNTAASSTATPTNYKIDFTKEGSQEYVDSIVALFASWGVDFIRLDAVSPSTSNIYLDNQLDVAAWGKAIAKNRHPIWLTLSSSLDQDYVSTWEQYSNARRIGGDIECESTCFAITSWALTSQRLYDLIPWQNYANAQAGWNDLGPLEVGNASISGLSPTEQQSAVTFWAMANSPMYLGGDLTIIDSSGLDLVTNDEVLAVDQSGHPANQVAGGMTPVWVGDAGDGSFYVAMFNLNAFPSPVTIRWSTLGFEQAPSVRDVWAHKDLGAVGEKFSANVLGHGVRLLKVTMTGRVERELSQSYEAESAVPHGSTIFSTCKACSGSNKAMRLGLDVNSTLTFNNIYVDQSGTYRMEIAAATSGPRNLFFQVNGDPLASLKFGGSSFNQPSSTIVPVKLQAGYNTIQFGNPFNAAPDLDRIAVIGQGFALPSTSEAYEAETAQLGGTEYTTPCPYCSGGSKVTSLDQSTDNTVTFPDVSATGAGLYDLEINYVTDGAHSLFLRINDGEEIALNLVGSSSSLPTSTVIPVALKHGKNKIQFGSHDAKAPALDRIAIESPLDPTTLATSLVEQSGEGDERVWKLSVTNSGEETAHDAQINLLSLAQAGGQGACQPKVTGALPVNVGDIPRHEHVSVSVPLDFSNCSEDALFNALIVFSSDKGAVVGNAIVPVSSR